MTPFAKELNISGFSISRVQGVDSAETEVNATRQGELAETVSKALKRGCLLIPPSKLSYSFTELYRQRDSGKCNLD